MSAYSDAYYESLQDSALHSAREVVPLVLDCVQPRRVVDVGCGVGAWLAVFKEHGVAEIQGIDGPWVERELLHIPKDTFTPANLEEPFQADRSFDLVVSLEVAEHLPSDCAEQFVDTLTKLGPVILFSAAVPFQGGTHHVNERWPVYWAEHFLDRGYVAVDGLRQKIWQNDQVAWWYAQNALFFVRRDCLDDYPLLKQERERTAHHSLPLVHPRLYLSLQDRDAELEERVNELGRWGAELQKQVETLRELRPGHVSLRKVLRALPALAKHALVRRIKDTV